MFLFLISYNGTNPHIKYLYSKYIDKLYQDIQNIKYKSIN